MAEEKLRIIVDDILTTIKQTMDDKSVTRAQVAYWTIIVGNQLLGQHIAKRDSGAFLSTFTDVPVIIPQQNSNPDVVKNRKHVELPAAIFDYDIDGGIGYIAYESDGGPACPPRFTKQPFTRTTPRQAQWLYMNAYTKPSPKNPYWYRTGNKIYLLGLEQIVVKKVEMGIYMTIDPLQEIDIDKPFRFPAELLHILKRQVLDMARFSFFFPKDRQNTGSDETMEEQSQGIPKVVSVNAQDQQQ